MKKKFNVFKLHFKSGFHSSAGGFGNEDIDLCIHSDTLFSAVCSCANLIYGSSGVEKLINTKELIISSTFPFIKGEYYLPIPAFFLPSNFDQIEYKYQKKFKKVRFVEKSLFGQIVKGSKPPFDQTEDHHVVLQNCWRSRDTLETERYYSEIEHPRVTLDRITNESTVFYFSEFRFAEDAGLYFIADWGDKDDLNMIFTASLRLLGDEGIGCDRNVGKGKFVVEKEFIVLDIPENSDHQMVLSLYSPTQPELDYIDFGASFFDIIVRQGWTGTALRRKSLRMIGEGSVLKTGTGICGTTHRVLENPPVFRYGKTLVLPVVIN